MKRWFTRKKDTSSAAAPPAGASPKVTGPLPDVDPLPVRSPYEQRIAALRYKVESLQGDKPRGVDGIKYHTVKIGSLVLPVLALLAIGDIVGLLLSGMRTFTFADPTVVWTYVLSYACEGTAMILTYALQSAVQKQAKQRGEWVAFIVTALVWLLMLAGTSILLYIFGTLVTHISGQLAEVGLVVRSIASTLVCLGSAFGAYWTRGKTLPQELADYQHRHHAFTALHQAESSLHQAEKQMLLQEKQDEAYMKAREQNEQLVLHMGEVSQQIIMQIADKATMPQNTIESNNGYRRRL